ncbi:hypothetical protein GCM10020295_70150 [Streptomyces cinereospinus]
MRAGRPPRRGDRTAASRRPAGRFGRLSPEGRPTTSPPGRRPVLPKSKEADAAVVHQNDVRSAGGEAEGEKLPGRPVVGGVALLLAFGRNGMIGRWLDAWFGVTVPFTTAGVVIAETFVAMPFLVIGVEGRCAPPAPATRRRRPPWAPPAAPRSAASPSR